MTKKVRLVRIDSKGTDPRTGNKQEILIDSITHLGRSRKDDHAEITLPADYDRYIPANLLDVEVALFVRDRSVSRVHSMIYPPGIMGVPGYVVDLNSTNGTCVNGKRIPSGKKRALEENDTIRMGTVEFKYHELPPASYTNYALMVGHFGLSLQGVLNDISQLKNELAKRGFAGQFEELINRDATIENIRSKLAVMKRLVTNDSIFLLYFSGHGFERALGFGQGKLRVEDGFLTADTLFRSTMDFRGQKLFILDGCYTDSMFRKKMPPRSAFIGVKNEAAEGGITRIYGNVMSYLTQAVVKALSDHPHRLDLDTLVDRINRDKYIHSVRQQVAYRRQTSIFLPSICQAFAT